MNKWDDILFVIACVFLIILFGVVAYYGAGEMGKEGQATQLVHEHEHVHEQLH